METTKLNVLDKFQRELYQYIKEEQPQLLQEEDIKEFIVKRAKKANDTYIEESKIHPHIMAMEIAMGVLYTDM